MTEKVLFPLLSIICCLHLMNMCVRIMLSTVLVAEWPPFGKELLTRLTVCFLYTLPICNVTYFQFWFRGQAVGSHCTISWSLLTPL